MNWNYAYNCPYDKYRELTVCPEKFKAEVSQWVSELKEQGLLDADGEQCITNSLESVGYNLHEFMLAHAYDMITDASLREYFIVYMCLAYSPSHNFIPFNMEEYRQMGDINILRKANDMNWGQHNTISCFDIYCRYYFCESEEDIWDIFADGIGNLEELINYYRQDDEEKAMKALLYIYSANNKLVAATTGKNYQAIPKTVKEEVVSILRNEYFEGMYDNFFIEENLEQAKLAWNTGVVEIRQEFVRDENAINILKKII